MCGIAGIIDRSGRAIDDVRLRVMTDAVAHRGPDGSGIYIDGNVGLGHRRLAIIDLTEGGHQPMKFRGESLVLTFNGEIYNYLELRSELEQAGYVFRSRTDSEVILAAYDRWGETCVTRFNGMWAFAIHDRANRAVFCARDRFGVKPFYYVDTGRLFAFGSEIRQLLPLLEHVGADRENVLDFILTGASDHGDGTFYANVSRLAAGHTLTFDLGTGLATRKPFYELRAREDVGRLARDEAVDRFRQCLTDAVRLRLRSDVPVGTCLSGGLDSSSIAAIAAPLYAQGAGRPFAAITAVSEEEGTDESRYAQQVVRHARLRWLTVRPTYEVFVDCLPGLVRAQEEPFGSTSLAMQYCVMRTARENLTPVLLDGQGGDETLLGYEKYYPAAIVSTFRREGFASALRAVADARRSNAKLNVLTTAKYFLGSTLARARWGVYCRRHNYLRSRPMMPQWLSEFSRAIHDGFALQKLEISRTNLPVLLRYEDKNSMAHAVETRLPFLDYRLVEMALSLPTDYKIYQGWSKWVLRAAMEDRMPGEVIWRKNKFGFESPERIWLGRHRKEMWAAIQSSALLADLCRPEKLRARFATLDLRSQWRLYSVALWEREFRLAS